MYAVVCMRVFLGFMLCFELGAILAISWLHTGKIEAGTRFLGFFGQGFWIKFGGFWRPSGSHVYNYFGETFRLLLTGF